MNLDTADWYKIYTVGQSTQYLTCLFTATQLLLGGDYYPMTTAEVLCAAVGIFLGAIINANIFGELVVIMESMGKDEKMF